MLAEGGEPVRQRVQIGAAKPEVGAEEIRVTPHVGERLHDAISKRRGDRRRSGGGSRCKASAIAIATRSTAEDARIDQRSKALQFAKNFADRIEAILRPVHAIGKTLAVVAEGFTEVAQLIQRLLQDFGHVS